MERSTARTLSVTNTVPIALLDYFNMLYSGVQLYTANNDTYSAAVCRECLLEIPELLSKVEENTSSIAFRITDTPNFNLPADYIAKLKELNG